MKNENETPKSEKEIATCDGSDHYDENGNWIEACPEAGTWPKEGEV